MAHLIRFATRPISALLTAAIMLLPQPSFAAQNKLMLVAQFDWQAKTGFFIDLENEAPDGRTIPINSMKLALGVGNGSSWAFTVQRADWQIGKSYTVSATITPQSSTLSLDGGQSSSPAGTFAPDINDSLRFNSIPDEAKAQASYSAVVSDITVQRNAEQPIDELFAEADTVIARDQFSGGGERETDFKLSSTDSLRITAIFTISHQVDLHSFSPLIDKYGQLKYSDPPPTLTTDQQLRERGQAEDAALKNVTKRPGFDSFGGIITPGWKEKATGFYRTAKRNGYWWLITPDGNPCFYIGLCTAPALHWDVTPVTGREYMFADLPNSDAEFADAWSPHAWGDKSDAKYYSFVASNLIRKYGRAAYVKDSNLSTQRRLAAWGFSGVGKWGDFDGSEAVSQTPSIPVLDHDAVPNLGRHPDIFDPKVCAVLRQTLEDQIGTHTNDPYIVGWSCGNELDDLITKEDVDDALAMQKDSPLKRALVKYVIDTQFGDSLNGFLSSQNMVADSLDEIIKKTIKVSESINMKLRIFWMDKYYGFMYKAVKAYDPNHLYFGFWPSLNEFPPSKWPLTTKWCDVFGYDYYSPEFANAAVAEFFHQIDKPVLCGEFSFAPWNGGKAGFGRYEPYAKDETDQISLYNRWARDAAASQKCVGFCWFQYRDEPVTGRGPGHGDQPVIGENYAFGFVDITDTPKQKLVDAIAKINSQAPHIRLEASK